MTTQSNPTGVGDTLAGICVPAIANSLQLRNFVRSVHEACDGNGEEVARLIGVTSATVWKLVKDEQQDSQIVRDALGIRKTPVRPRVWMPTNNIAVAVSKLFAHYSREDIARTIAIYDGMTEDLIKRWRNVLWNGTGEEGDFDFEGIGRLLDEQ